jgi:hypothetical protein
VESFSSYMVRIRCIQEVVSLNSTMLFVAQTMIRGLFITITVVTIILIYHNMKVDKWANSGALHENPKTVLTFDVALRVLVMMIPLLLLGSFWFFFVTSSLRFEAVLLALVWVQVPVVFYALRRICTDREIRSERHGDSHDY